MSREWPSGWEDPEEVELDAVEPDEETEVRLSEVAAFLATVPAPVLPGAIEARISAALAAESAARAEQSAASAEQPAPEPDRSRTLGPAPARARVRRFPRLRPAMVAGPLLACLLFAGIGYAISNTPSSSSSSSAVAAAPAASSAASSGAGAARTSYSASTGQSDAGSVVSVPRFVLIRSGTHYQKATLAAQVRDVLAISEKYALPVPSTGAGGNGSKSAPVTSAPAASASASASATRSFGVSAVPSGLRQCVLHLTGEVIPRLIDRASYAGTPVYVIATASRVWVVGLGCTVASPDVIVTAPLAS